MRVQRLAAAFREGKRPALARALSMVEGRRPGAEALLDDLLGVPPRARRFGITGPPGAGKSSLAAGLAALLRARGEEVAIVAVDPTSPFSGGALLGDRIRMNDLTTDRGVFIRSMATRGSLGGLAATTREVVDLLDAFGFPNVLVETVGVGQTELEIASAVDSVAVVLVPESGDGIQALKAGLMEIADVFVVNKSDRPGADRLVRDIRLAMHLKAGQATRGVPAHHGVDLSRAARGPQPRRLGQPPDADPAPTPGQPLDANPRNADPAPAGDPSPDPNSPPATVAPEWDAPVLQTSAGRGEGIDVLLDAILAHHGHLQESSELERRRDRRARQRIGDIVESRLHRRAARVLAADPRFPKWAADVAAGRATAYGVAAKAIPDILKGVAAPRSG